MGWYNFAFGVDVATVTVSACRCAPTQKPRQFYATLLKWRSAVDNCMKNVPLLWG